MCFNSRYFNHYLPCIAIISSLIEKSNHSKHWVVEQMLGIFYTMHCFDKQILIVYRDKNVYLMFTILKQIKSLFQVNYQDNLNNFFLNFKL